MKELTELTNIPLISPELLKTSWEAFSQSLEPQLETRFLLSIYTRNIRARYFQLHMTTDPWRWRVSSCGCPCLELSAVLRQRRGCLSTAAEDSAVQDILLRGCWYRSRVAVSTRLFAVC